MGMLQIEVDEELLTRVEERATRLGKPRSEVIVEALRRDLGRGRLGEILGSGRRRSSLSEDEAMLLAITELKAFRTERTSADTA